MKKPLHVAPSSTSATLESSSSDISSCAAFDCPMPSQNHESQQRAEMHRQSAARFSQQVQEHSPMHALSEPEGLEVHQQIWFSSPYSAFGYRRMHSGIRPISPCFVTAFAHDMECQVFV